MFVRLTTEGLEQKKVKIWKLDDISCCRLFLGYIDICIYDDDGPPPPACRCCCFRLDRRPCPCNP
jgi:hypothetical protein